MVRGQGKEPPVLRAIKTFLKDPPAVDSLDQIVPGLNIVEGIIKVAEPLRSPVRGQNCVAYFYRSFLVIPPGGRSPMPTVHKLREAEVYGPFELEMKGGSLKVLPARPGTFTREDHQALSRQYIKNFQATEDLILPGARVQLRGKARLVDGGAMAFTMTKIVVLAKQAVSAGVVGNRKERRKRKP
jgi:hypothetical protein